MTGPGAVKGERMGLFPLAVQELAEEFRRLAAEAVENREKFRETQESYRVTFYNGMRVAYQRAAQMLEEKLNG